MLSWRMQGHGTTTTHPIWLQCDNGSMVSVVDEEYVKLMGLRIEHRPKKKWFNLAGVGATQEVRMDAVIQVSCQARRVLGPPALQRGPPPLHDVPETISYTLRLAIVRNCPTDILIGGDEYRHQLQLHEDWDNGLVITKYNGIDYACDQISWKQAVTEMNSTPDHIARKAVARHCAITASTVRLASTLTGSVPAHSVGVLAIKKSNLRGLTGMVRIEIVTQSWNSTAVSVEPTVCHVDRPYVSVANMTHLPVLLLEGMATVRVIPIILQPSFHPEFTATPCSAPSPADTASTTDTAEEEPNQLSQG
jgi:hypothetical protein